MQRIQQALDSGNADHDDVAQLLRGQRKDWKPWHDFGVVCLEYFYNVALELGGPDYLDELLAQHVVKFKVIKGHSGHPENERCDELAVAAARAARE